MTVSQQCQCANLAAISCYRISQGLCVPVGTQRAGRPNEDPIIKVPHATSFSLANTQLTPPRRTVATTEIPWEQASELPTISFAVAAIQNARALPAATPPSRKAASKLVTVMSALDTVCLADLWNTSLGVTSRCLRVQGHQTLKTRVVMRRNLGPDQTDPAMAVLGTVASVLVLAGREMSSVLKILRFALRIRRPRGVRPCLGSALMPRRSAVGRGC